MSSTVPTGGQPDDFSDISSSAEPDPQVIPGNSEFGNRNTRAYKLKVLRESDADVAAGRLVDAAEILREIRSA